MKKISVKPIETLTIEFVDGTTKTMKFSALAMMILDEEFEGFITISKDAQKKPFLAGAKLIYAGTKAIEIENNGDSKFEFIEAKKLAVNMTIEDITYIFDFAAKTLGEKKPPQK